MLVYQRVPQQFLLQTYLGRLRSLDNQCHQTSVGVKPQLVVFYCPVYYIKFPISQPV